VEAAPRLDRHADDDELRMALRRDTRDLVGEAPGPRPHDLATHRDAVGGRDRRRGLEPLLEARERPVEVRVQRQLALEHGRRDEHDPRAAVGREATGEVEGVLGLLPVEQRHDDAAIGDRARPTREAPGAAMEQVEVGAPHRRS
jgi:hypothetical protein